MKRGTEWGYAEVNGHIVPTSRHYAEEYDPNSYDLRIIKRYVGDLEVYEDDYLDEEEEKVYRKKCLEYGQSVTRT